MVGNGKQQSGIFFCLNQEQNQNANCQCQIDIIFFNTGNGKSKYEAVKKIPKCFSSIAQLYDENV